MKGAAAVSSIQMDFLSARLKRMKQLGQFGGCGEDEIGRAADESRIPKGGAPGSMRVVGNDYVHTRSFQEFGGGVDYL